MATIWSLILIVAGAAVAFWLISNLPAWVPSILRGLAALAVVIYALSLVYNLY